MEGIGVEREAIIPKHGGYRRLKSFQLAQLVYDLTVRFCDRYVEKKSRTRDQMVQAARSGVQNIAEGSQASGTSKKTELKLTNVARASLEELRLDYEDYLRQRGLPMLANDDPAMARFKRLRCSTLEEVVEWVGREHELSNNTDEHGHTRTDTDKKSGGGPVAMRSALRRSTKPSNSPKPAGGGHGPSVSVGVRPCSSVPSSALAANAALALLNICCYLLDRQLATQAASFETEGGITERLYRVRSQARHEQRPTS